MTNKIKELALQAGLIADEHDDLDFKKNLTTKEKKFAELMVKKFDDILVLEHLDCVGNRDKQAEERIQRLREKVKTYFGVEE